ncbi:MAG: histidine kinase [Mucinivorans sp.]
MSLGNTIRKKKYLLTVVVISAMVSVLIHFPESISLFDQDEHEALFPGMRMVDVFGEVLFTLVSLLLMFWLNTLLFKFNNPLQKIDWFRVVLSFLLTWLVSNILATLFVRLHGYYNIPAIDSMLHHYLHPLRDFIMATVVSGSCYIIHLGLKQQHMAIENQQLRTESLRNQYEVLKNQLNPHMLFNSLNTLQALIRDEPIKAQQYTQELSNVLRYTLSGNCSRTVTLSQEMDFVEAYIYLLKMRYQENIRFQIDIQECYCDYLLPPMSVQLLIENAVKHNEISARRPLTITITTPQQQVVVQNAIQSKRTKTTGTAIGLSNLEARYKLLFHKPIECSVENDTFCVKLPLINRIEYESSDC